jgi:hypothetical protein
MNNKMRMVVSAFAIILCASSCNIGEDPRIELAKQFVIKEDEKSMESFPAKLVDFRKTNGEDYEGMVLGRPGLNKLYKFYYRATYESLVTGYVLVRVSDSMSYSEIYKKSGSSRYGNFFYSDYYEKELKPGDLIYVDGSVRMKNTDNGWEVLGY